MNNISLSNIQWQTIFGAVAAVCAFLLAQPDVALDPIVKVVLGAVIVALAVINPKRGEA